MDGWRIVHLLAMAWLGAGLGATYPLILRAWASKDVKYQMYAIVEAANNETRFFWGVAEDYDYIRDGWLAALSLSFIFFYFICLPLMGFGLRRARIAALIAAKRGDVTDDLRQVLDDRVPLVFSTLLVLSVPWMAWLAIFKPF
jgi:hypothetical protein